MATILKNLKGDDVMKIDRLVSIIMILLDKERISAQELADLFEVSTRTIYRDIDAINMAGIPICSTSGVGGGFQIMPQYKLDKKVFSNTDLSAIMMGLSLLSNLSNVVQDHDLVNALTKIKSFIPPDSTKDIALKANQIYIDLSPWTINRNIQPYLEVIQLALHKNKLLAFEYTGKHTHKTERIIEPYQLVLKNSHWYLYGYCHKRNDFRLFKLSRISNLQMKTESFTPRDYPNPQLEFNDILQNLQKEIKIRIHQSIMEQVLDYCTYEHFSPDGEEHYLVNFPFIENDYYYNILFSFGNKCECLEPLHVREEIKRRIHDMAMLYES